MSRILSLMALHKSERHTQDRPHEQKSAIHSPLLH